MHEKWETALEYALQALRTGDTRRKETDVRTEGDVFDAPTLEALSQLISHGALETLDYCLSTGKEANVFRGTTPEGAHVAVKIYRVLTSTFRAHQDYIWGDPRFQTTKMTKRELVETWASKEFKNLARLIDAGCRVPTPFMVKRNVLLMEFVGEDGVGAPLLKDTRIDDPQAAYETLATFVRDAWRKGDLVHGDLSEFNVLVHGDELVIIDTAQAVLKAHPRARELLDRDARNVVRYFKRLGATADAPGLVKSVLGPKGKPKAAAEPRLKRKARTKTKGAA